jgi:hypothetical protein
MAEYININPQDLITLANLMGDRNKENAATALAAIRDVPFMYKAVASTPKFTGSPLIDAGIGMVAPLMADSFGGMKNSRFLPSVDSDSGVSVFEAVYASEINNKFYRRASNQMGVAMGGAMANTVADSINFMAPDLAKSLGMTPESLRRNLADMAQHPIGQVVTQLAAQLPVMQNIMGGNPYAMMDTLTANRQALSFDARAPINPLDLAGQASVARQSTDLQRELLTSIRGDKDGKIGLLPNYNFTRGFRDEEIGDTAVELARRGVQLRNAEGAPVRGGTDGQTIQTMSTMGVDAEDSARLAKLKAATTGQMMRTLEVMKELSGGGSVRELFAQLDQLTQGTWTRGNNIQNLEGTLRRMTATAHLLGVSNNLMMSTVDTMQQSMLSAAGISPQAALMGVNAGGYSGVEMATHMASRAIATSQATGQPLEEVKAQQIAASTIARNSPRGKDIAHIAYLREQGVVSDAEYQQLDQLSKNGDVTQSRALVDQIFTRFYGSAEEGRELSNNPATRQRIAAGSSGATAIDADRLMWNAMDSEIVGRMRKGAQNEIMGTTAVMARRTGTTLLGRDEASKLALEGIVTTLGGVTGGDQMVKQVRDVYARALEADPNKRPEVAMEAVNTLLSRDTQFAPYMDAIKVAQQGAQNAAVVTRLQTPETRELIRNRGEMQAAEASGMDLKTMRAYSDKVRDVLTQAGSERVRGNTDKAVELEQQALRSWDDIKRGMGDTQRTYVTQAGTKAIESTDRDQATLTAKTEMERRIIKGQTTAASASDIVTESTAINQLYKVAKEKGKYTDEEMAEITTQVQGMSTISDDQKKSVISSLKGGPQSAEFKKAAKEQGAVSVFMTQNEALRANEQGIDNLVKAIGSMKSSSDITKYLESSVGRQATVETQMGDLNQNLRMTFAQRGVKMLTGKGGNLASVFGLTDEDISNQFVKDFQTTALGKEVQTEYNALNATRTGLTESVDSIIDLGKDKDIKASGMHRVALKVSEDMARLAGSGDLDDATYKDMVTKFEGQARDAGLSTSQISGITDKFGTHRKAVTAVIKQQEKLNTVIEKVDPETWERASVERRIEQSNNARREQYVTEAFKRNKVDDEGGLFVQKLDTSKKDVQELLKEVVGEDVYKKDGAKGAVKRISAMTDDDIKGLSLKQREAVAELSDVAAAQRVEEGKKEAYKILGSSPKKLSQQDMELGLIRKATGREDITAADKDIALRDLEDLSPRQVKKLEPEKRAALEALQKIKGDKLSDEESSKSKPVEVEITGQVTLFDQAGNYIGFMDHITQARKNSGPPR